MHSASVPTHKPWMNDKMTEERPKNVVLTKEELQTPRTAAEMLNWVHAALERFNTRQLRAAAREGKHFAKELTDEALPIALFAQRHYDASPDVTISHAVGSQQYDATVEDRRGDPSPIQYIETTVSDRDYTESLRMEILNRNGSVPAYGTIRAEGPKGRRTNLKAESAAVKHDEIRNSHIAAVIDALNSKAKKKYPDNTALVVRIDDAGPFREASDLAELDKAVRLRGLPLLSDREFVVLALVGSQGAHLLYELPGGCPEAKE